MTGAVLGAVHGTPWLDGLDRTVQDADYIRRTAGALADHSNGQAPADRDRSVTAASVKEFLGRLRGPGPTALPDGRKAVVTRVHPLAGSGRTSAVQFLVTAGDGQTLAFDIVSKRTLPQPADAALPFPEPTDGNASEPGRAVPAPPAGPAHAGAYGDSQPAHQASPATEDPGRRAGLVETRLAAADVDRSAYFYLRVLGLPGRRHGHALTIEGGLVVDETALATPSSAVLCVLASDDVDAAAARLRSSKYGHLLVAADHGYLLVNDPDGHRLQIVARHTARTGPPDEAADRRVGPADVRLGSDRTIGQARHQATAAERAQEKARHSEEGKAGTNAWDGSMDDPPPVTVGDDT